MIDDIVVEPVDKVYRDPRKKIYRRWKKHVHIKELGNIQGFDKATGKPILRRIFPKRAGETRHTQPHGIINENVPDYHTHGASCAICHDVTRPYKYGGIKARIQASLHQLVGKYPANLEEVEEKIKEEMAREHYL